MNEQDAVVLPILVTLVALIVFGVVVFSLARLAGILIERSAKSKEMFKARLNEAIVSYRHDPAGDTLKYSVSFYFIVLTLLMIFLCCILPILSMITGRALLELFPQPTIPPEWNM